MVENDAEQYKNSIASSESGTVVGVQSPFSKPTREEVEEAVRRAEEEIEEKRKKSEKAFPKEPFFNNLIIRKKAA